MHPLKEKLGNIIEPRPFYFVVGGPATAWTSLRIGIAVVLDKAPAGGFRGCPRSWKKEHRFPHSLRVTVFPLGFFAVNAVNECGQELLLLSRWFPVRHLLLCFFYVFSIAPSERAALASSENVLGT